MNKSRPAAAHEAQDIQRSAPLPEFLTTTEVADLLRVPAETMRYWRHIGKGPRSFKIGGRRVLYDRRDVEAFIDEARIRQSDSPPS
jgi:excisionase family DNA binding protein